MNKARSKALTLWANTIVNNEENFLYFAVMSVADFVDKILIWDTGSKDKTVEVIKSLQEKLGEKIEFRQMGEVNENQFTNLRQKMLEESQCDWILILDGDEVWWRDSIKEVRNVIEEKGKEIEGIVVPMKVPVGDIFHMQEEQAGQYKILGKKGHLSLKVFSKRIPGLYVDWPYGKEGFFDEDKRLIQEREKIIFHNAYFLHVTHLKRSSSKRKYNKFKYELGSKVSSNFKYPEVLYREYPAFISSPWVRISGMKKIAAKFLTPIRRAKRRII